MQKKNTNEHDYYKNIENCITYHYNKNNLDQRELTNVLSYCRSNWTRIGTHEVESQNANVLALMKIKPIDICRYFKYLAYGIEEPGPNVKPTKRRANSLLAYEQNSMKKQLERESQLNAKRFKRLESRIDNLSTSIDRVIVFRSGKSNLNGPANLYDCKTLSQLWAEYQIGLNGNKPARLFTMNERNAPGMKFRYHWRKNFWSAMVTLTRHTAAEVAVERLGVVYGVTLKGGISGVCKRLGKDKELRKYYEQHPM